MDDKTLLELAAKAAGIDGRFIEQDAEGGYPTYSCGIGKIGDITTMWNPLEDDGDALRLACELRLDVFWDPPSESVMVESTIDDVPTTSQEYEEYLDSKRISVNRSQALRRAIVRAAAAIGESL